MINSKGITLTSLVIYIIIMLMVIGVISSVSLMFYSNTEHLDNATKDMAEFNNFNNYFIKEIKSANNKINQISEDGKYIIFDSGNSFIQKDNKIFFNDLQISKNVNNINFAYYKDTEGKQHKDIVAVSVEFENYSKTMNYKIEEIY